MSNIFINAISVREGGSLIVLQELLHHMPALRPGWRWHVALNNAAADQLPCAPNMEFHVVPAMEIDSWRIHRWYEFRLPALLEAFGADLLFSQTNYLPFRKLNCQTLLLIQHAGHFSARFRELLLSSQPGIAMRAGWDWKNFWVKRSARMADILTVQTLALARQISNAGLHRLEEIQVVPHGPGLMSGYGEVRTKENAETLRIGYISKFGVQKNFVMLFESLAMMRVSGQDFRLVLTLNPRVHENRRLLAVAEDLGLAGYIENHGELQRTDLMTLYRELHCLVFPSICESFGFPLVEAMTCGLPVLVADTASNLEVAGPAAIVFPPDDPARLAGLLQRLSVMPEWMLEQSRKSLAQASRFSWLSTATRYVTLMETLIQAHDRG